MRITTQKLKPITIQKLKQLKMSTSMELNEEEAKIINPRRFEIGGIRPKSTFWGVSGSQET